VNITVKSIKHIDISRTFPRPGRTFRSEFPAVFSGLLTDPK